VYSRSLKSAEFKRWLEKQGAILAPGKGSHLHVTFKDRTSVLPMHSKELGKGLVAAIKKQLGLK
jgi:predicted RNA binding protein YcfA (HicA-like mRNA interferase family)